MIGALVKMEKNYEVNLVVVGGRIRQARLRLGLTQRKAAERTNISDQYWSLIETGRERGSVNTYLQITKALGLTLDDIFYADAEALHVRKTLSRDELLTGCTSSEKAIICEALLSLKTILRKYRGR